MVQQEDRISAPDIVVINTTNSAPIADAGADQSVSVGSLSVLDGSASSDADNDPLTYKWTITNKPANSTAALLNPTSVKPSFTVDKPGIYSVQLIVNDGRADSEAAITLVTTLNARPVANAGPDQAARVNGVVTLDGSASSDVDGDPITYTWSLMARPIGSTAALNDPTAVKPEFIVDKPGVYVAQLIIHDKLTDSEPDTVTITTENSRPVANPGLDQTATLNSRVQLDGTASNDPDNDPLAYQWAFVSKPSNSIATLTNAATASPSFTLDKPGNYVLELIVSDGKLESMPMTVTISTQNSRPVADAGIDQVASQSLILLDGSASSDADNNPLIYQWSLLSKPADSQATLIDPASSQPSFTADLPGFYVSQLIVNDGKLDSDPDTVTVEVPSILFNHPPVITTEAPLLAQVGQAYNYNVDASDSDVGDLLVFSLVAGPEGMTIDPNSGVIQWTPVLAQLGQQEVTVEVRDSFGAKATQSFSISVSSATTTVSVPNLTGLSRKAAESAITSVKLTIGAVTFQRSDTVASGNVIQMTPSAGTVVEQATPVSLLVSLGKDNGLPPDPAVIAPSLDPNAPVTPFNETVGFLYSGSHPVQTGVAAGAIDTRRVAVMRGKVLTRDNQALSGVAISVKDHPELGQTLSRIDGQFDLAVNGGGYLTLNYQKTGYLPVQRQVDTPWQDFVAAEDVVMIPMDSKVTAVDLNATEPQAAQGSVSTDADGQRQATVLFPVGTQATMTMPDGSTQPLTDLHVRATEYTVGENGPKTMPAPLPPSSSYTYAVELSVDEAQAAGASRVNFNQPIPLYVDNFLNFPTGTIVPVGWYDRVKGTWVASDNGRVIKILSISDGIAALDIGGDGYADNEYQLAALGITPEEQAQLATLYAPGKTVWRAPITHFTPWDLNWVLRNHHHGAPPTPPTTDPEEEPPPDEDCDECEGSVINAQTGTVGEKVAVTGTPYTLNYQSRRADGYNKSKRTFDVPLSRSTVPRDLKGIELEINVAGQTTKKSYPPTTNLSDSFEWDGLDGYGRKAIGDKTATVKVSYMYDIEYYNILSSFKRAFDLATGADVSITIGGRSSAFSAVSTTFDREVSGSLPKQAFENWGVNVNHQYDPVRRILRMGNGTQHQAEANVNYTINTVAGDGAYGYSQVSSPRNIVAAPDGSFYISSSLPDNRQGIIKIGPDGAVTTVVGEGGTPIESSSDGSLATGYFFNNPPKGLSLGPDGSIFLVDANSGIYRISSDGVLNKVAGFRGVGDGGVYSQNNGDGGPVTEASIGNLGGGIAVAKDGSVYFTEVYSTNRVRKIAPDGTITTAIGNPYYVPGDGGSAASATISSPNAIAVGPDGSLYVCEGNRIRRVMPEGIVSTIAGGDNLSGYSGDGGPANQAQIGGPASITVDKDGTIYFADGGNQRIRKISTDGIIASVAGGGTTIPSSLDDEPATQAYLGSPNSFALGPDGGFYFSDSNSNRIYRLSSPKPILTPPQPGKTFSELLIASPDGKELYNFDKNGRHLTTLNALTGSQLYAFGYDSAGRLAQITDADNNVTVLERDNFGHPTAIVSPYGQRTAITFDAKSHIASVANPSGEAHRFTHTADGLLTQFTGPRGTTTNLAYDGAGRILTDTNPSQGGWAINRTKNASGSGFTNKMTTGSGREMTANWVRYWDKSHQQVNTYPDGTSQTKLFKTNGEKLTTRPDGTQSSAYFGADLRFGMKSPIPRSTSIKLPSGLTSTSFKSQQLATESLLNFGTLTEATTINGKTYASVFDKTTLIKTQTSPVGRKIASKLNNKGRPEQTKIANFASVNYQYDTRGRLSQISQGLAPDTRTSQVSYNAQGYPATLTDALNNVTAFDYDGAGRVTRQVLPDNREINYAYDANGNLTSITPPGRPPHVYSFTPVNLVQNYTPPTAGLGNPQTLYQYNKDKQLTKVTRPDLQELIFTYGATSGKLTGLSLPTGDYGYQYAPATGKLSAITAPDGGRLNYTYDGFLLKDVTWTGTVAGSVSRTYNTDFNVTELRVNGANPITFQYDNDQLLTKAGNLILGRHAQNGLVASSTLGVVSDLYGYNAFGEVNSYTAKGSGANVFTTAYTHDALGRISQKQETVLGQTHIEAYTYDAAGRLTEVKRDGAVLATYGYDQNGNRTTVNGNIVANYDDQDRLISYGNSVYTYTANGELLSKAAGTTTTTYDYDLLGNLKKVTLGNGDTIDYITDGQNRRIGKKVNGLLTKGWLYQDKLKPIAELDSNNQVISRFVYATDTNVPDYMIRNGSTYRIIKDHLGSPRLVIDVATNTVIQEMSYDVWGNVTKDTSPGFQPFGFAGGLYDPDTKLVRFRARDYDSHIGRWTTKDPIQFRGGDSNLYGYVLNDSVNWIDSNGLHKHHVFPRQFWEKSGMSKEVKDIFNNDIVETARNHNNEKHPPYNKRSGQIFEDFCKKNGIDNPDDITPNQARDFLDELKEDSEIDDFNRAQQEGTPLPILHPYWQFLLGLPAEIIWSYTNPDGSDSQ